MADNSNNSSTGIGFTGGLFLVFLVLKLGHVINWSWWWITSPLWIPLIAWLVLSCLLIILTVFEITTSNKIKGSKK
jgi:hypothetical protein